MALQLSRWKSHWPLLATLLIAVAIIVFVNPIREMPVKDDWAYFLTVRNFVDTGQYRLNDWSAPNFPFQVLYGSLFARALGGLSFTSLRISTLSLMMVGLVSFYFLALEHKIRPWQAGLLTVLLLASPLVMKFSFSFMTNIPFLSCELLALWLYTRGLRLRSYTLMFVGSLAAVAATLTRQFGMAFIPVLFFVWILGKERQRNFPLFVAGGILLIVAALWQLYAGLVTPNWEAAYHQPRQIQFLSRPDLILELFWRLALAFMYSALFCLPMLIPAFGEYASELRNSRERPNAPQTRLNLVLLIAPTTLILGALLYGTFGMGMQGVMPILAPNFDFIATYWARLPAALLTLVMIAGAVLFARICVLRYLPRPSEAPVSPADFMLDFVTLGILLLHLIFYNIADEYFIPLIPYALIVMARSLSVWLDRWRIPLTVATLFFLAISVLWVREYLEVTETQWQGAQKLVDSGVDPFDIDTSWEWSTYHGGFDQYLKEINYQPISLDRSGEYLNVWLPARLAHAHYLVGALDAPPDQPGFEILKTVPYEDVFLRTRYVYVLRRTTPP